MHIRSTPGRPGSRGVPTGFTLIELLISLVLGAVLIVAMSDAAGLFAENLEAARDTEDPDLDHALAEMCRNIERAWAVRQPSATRIEAVDPEGAVTTYFLDGTDLKVTVPGGRTGVLLSDVSAMAFDTDTTRRLRPTTPRSDAVDWYTETPAGSVTPMALVDGEAISFGLLIPSEAPEALKALEDVDEQVLEVSLDRMTLRLAYLPEQVPQAASGGESEPPGKIPPGQAKKNSSIGALVPANASHASGNSNGNGKTKVTVCHTPPGNPGNAHSITIGEPALSAHLAHGDPVGACGAEAEPIGILDIAVYEARFPGDARPLGGPLASVSFESTILPAAAYTWAPAGSGGTIVNHAPPGKPELAHSLLTADPALAAHLAHGDTLGENPATDTLVLAAPTVDVPLDLAGLGLALEAGRPYTVVLRFWGDGSVVLPVTSAPDETFSAVAVESFEGAGFTPRAMGAVRSLYGMRVVSQTAEEPAISRVSARIVLVDGRAKRASASVLNQVMAPNPWLGGVPTESPSLELQGL